MIWIRRIGRPWFLLLLCLAITHQVAQWIVGLHVPFLDSYLDPLLMMPIALHILLWERRLLFRKSLAFTFNGYALISYFIVVSLIAEMLLPRLRSGFVSDIWDVFCYALGTLFFALFFNKPCRI